MPHGYRETPAKTKLSGRRQALGISQAALAKRTGLALRMVQRLEQGQMKNPPIRYLTNLAIALRCQITDIAEDEWLEWTVFDQRAAEPPDAYPVRGD